MEIWRRIRLRSLLFVVDVLQGHTVQTPGNVREQNMNDEQFRRLLARAEHLGENVGHGARIACPVVGEVDCPDPLSGEWADSWSPCAVEAKLGVFLVDDGDLDSVCAAFEDGYRAGWARGGAS
jgi:hypothetical protein